MLLCEDYGPLDFQDACVRNAWSALLPAIIVLSLCIWSLPLPWPAPARRLFAYASIPFKSFLTLEEAEALLSDCRSEDVLDDTVHGVAPGPTWRTLLFAFSGMAEALCWVAYGSYSIYTDTHSLWKGIACFLKAICWLFTAIRTIAQPFSSAPMDLFSVYAAFFLGSILQLGGVLYSHFALQQPLPAHASVLGQLADLLIDIALLVSVLKMPLADRRGIVNIGENVSPETYTTLWRWITFSWIYPIIRVGRNTTLNEKDVWELGPTFKSKPVFVKFSAITRPTLLRRLWIANSMDITLDFLMTFVSVLFNYSGPFFLKRILDLIDEKNSTPETQGQAYIYAFLAFTCSLLKAETDVQHFWFARRLSCRLRSELMASIYDKALKRKDFSGITNKDIGSESKGKKTANASKTPKAGTDKQKKKPASKADEARAGADIGKIVNLMAGDTNRIGRTATLLYNIYSAPLEIMIASTFLYQLLGLSAFAGFFVLLVGWPFINCLTRRSVRIQKELLAQRDKRMTVVNELLSTVKFIKFFAWEERWIDKALDVREQEMQWLIKARTNSVLLNCLWTAAPILVSIVAFGVYVMQGNELTVGTAFTAIVLFNMIKSPLNVLPSWLVQILQTGVAIKRIEVYLTEDEVTDQVSSLKGTSLKQSISNSRQVGLGLENASLTWNTVNEHSDGKGRKRNPKKATRPSNSEDSDTSTVQDSASSAEQTAGRIFELRDVSIIFPEGQLTVVTGPTASGKTALLLAILGELTLLSGKIIMSKDPSHVDENGMTQCISYAAQTPWLRHQSIRDNILFGYPYDEERYNLVLECCALQPDLKMLEDGDQTEIGARGINLSGGQKARVALARAVYARTKYVLLDDPLSAVDSHTARFLYERLVRGPLLAKRTVILVTHHVDLVLPGAFYLVHMLDGRIDTQGIVADLRAQGIVDALVQESHHFVLEGAPETLEATTLVDPIVVAEQQGAAKKKKPRKLVKDEHREIGNVKWPIYKTYIEASSYWIWAILVAIAVIMQLSGISEKLWIKTWGEAYRNHVLETPTVIHGFTNSPTVYDQLATSAQVPWQFGLNMTNAIPYYSRIELPDPNQRPLFYVGVYAAIGLITGMLRILSVAAQYTGAVRASRNLFKRLLVTVMRATFRFHDTTPQGRLLNRFGKDLESIDASLAGSLQAVNSHLAGFFVSIITISVVFPYFLIPALFLGIVYLWLGIGYRNTNRDLRRMESNTRSPIYSHFGEILEGIVTVRAFSAEKQFLDALHLKLDTAMKMFYSFWMVNRWLLLNFDALSALAILITTLFSIHTLTNGAGLAGLCISSAMAFTNSVYWVCRNWTTLELDLNAVERIVEYLELPQEPPAIIESNRVPAYWPSKSATQDGLLKVENLEVKYAPELPSVLKNVSFMLKAGERVGLLGRTGSGKSTLAMSLLRFVDPYNGRIIIDGIDISTIGIYDLRSRVTFIPQDATLFSGTIRDNLDPFHEHDDQECIDVLRRVHIITDNADEISSPSPGRSSSANIREEDNTITESVSISSTNVDTNRVTVSLESKVTAGGTNFSQGQRQLIAMARALLRRNTIVILDEATSSIDFDTDTKIQATIRQEFSGSLLLTVAHRLRTIIDYDRLIVLDKGEVVEFDTPWNLINKEDGVFRDMCLKSGSYGELERAAGQKANVL